MPILRKKVESVDEKIKNDVVEEKELVLEKGNSSVVDEEKLSTSSECQSDLAEVCTSICKEYENFNRTAKNLTDTLSKEYDYTRFLESEIDRKKYHMDYLALKKALADDRAELDVTFEKIRECLDLGLKDLDLREKNATDVMDGMLQMLQKRVDDMVDIKESMDENLTKFRNDVTAASESEYKYLQGKCREAVAENTRQLEQVKSSVVEFLKACEKKNEVLIKHIPEGKRRFEWKDFILMGLSVMCFAEMIVKFVKG